MVEAPVVRCSVSRLVDVEGNELDNIQRGGDVRRLVWGEWRSSRLRGAAIHRGLGADAEDAHEVHRVSEVAGFAEDAVLEELGGADPEGRKRSLMTVVEMGGSRSSATVCWLTRR
ncbi:hypothetical protein ACIRRI_32605 [Streptomyces mirabilis]|uniref:hypothetical protein n=1 Tax=Streptomyces mirabilis TaxID=68239 RepID=UPI0038143AAB